MRCDTAEHGTSNANTERFCSLGCSVLSGLFLFAGGMVIWALLYAMVMQHYEVTMPGGHHFGGGDLTWLEAIGAGVLAGPFVGLAICSLCFRSLRWFRLPLASIFLIYPASRAFNDFSEYRNEYEALNERRQRPALEMPIESIKTPNKSEMATPRKTSD